MGYWLSHSILTVWLPGPASRPGSYFNW